MRRHWHVFRAQTGERLTYAPVPNDLLPDLLRRLLYGSIRIGEWIACVSDGGELQVYRRRQEYLDDGRVRDWIDTQEWSPDASR